METLAIVGSLLENFTFTTFVYYMGWSTLGQVISYLAQRYDKKDKIAESGGFSWGYFIKDNWVRYSLTVIAMALGVLFTVPMLSMIGITGVKLNELTAIGMGATTDMLIDRFRLGWFKKSNA